MRLEGNHFNFPSFGSRHSRPTRVPTHEFTSRRPVGDKNHPFGDFAGLALERSFAKFGPDQRHLPFREPDFGHVFLGHGHGVGQFEIFGRFFPHIDEGALLGGARGVEDEAFGGHCAPSGVCR